MTRTEAKMAHDERSSRRYVDRLRGFAYYESFDEVARWNESDVDALQRANTPIAPRPCPLNREVESSNVMLIHDYAGGYMEYESCQGATVPDEMYSCECLQSVETFVYFTHKMVTIPPPAWINTCHRNGVKVLGTFIVEPGSKNVERILQNKDGKFWLAQKLADMARCFGFDGWLINIETSFPLLHWSSQKLVGFLKHLKSEVGSGGKVVWYDGLTVLNIVWYQNTLNSLNLAYAQAAGSILTNYAWTPELASSAKKTAQLNGIDVHNVYFGIDVWAQNKQHGRNKRVTFPRNGGGGTGTGLGMKETAKLGLSTGIFAPAWSFEHFHGQSRAVEQAIWQGHLLPRTLQCECDMSLHVEVPYQDNPVQKYATQYPAGSKNFFHTDYQRAFSKNPGSTVTTAHLAQAAILPARTRATFTTPQLGSEPNRSRLVLSASVSESNVSDLPSRCSVSAAPQPCHSDEFNIKPTNSMSTARLALHDVNISGGANLELVIKYSKPALSDALVSVFVESSRESYSISLPYEAAELSKTHMPIKFDEGSVDVICGVEVKLAGQSASLQTTQSTLLDIYALTIRAVDANPLGGEITHAWVEHHASGDMHHDRLTWTIAESSDPSSNSDRPYSSITGPFSYFAIFHNDRYCGRAYALQFMPNNGVLNQDKAVISSSDVFRIAGYGFDDELLAEKTLAISSNLADDGWVVIDN